MNANLSSMTIRSSSGFLTVVRLRSLAPARFIAALVAVTAVALAVGNVGVTSAWAAESCDEVCASTAEQGPVDAEVQGTPTTCCCMSEGEGQPSTSRPFQECADGN